MAIVSPPWNLNGSGFILSHSFKTDWLLENGFVPPHLHKSFKGGLSFTMLVNYESSDVGAYKELLFIPGLFQIDGKYHLMVTKIYVDTVESVESGRSNWGIPKELAKINWIEKDNSVSFSAENAQGKFFNMDLKSSGLAFPVNNHFLPFKIYQELEGNSFLSKPIGKGKGKVAKPKNTKISGQFFPNLREGRLINVLHVNEFKMKFPKSEI